MRDGIRSIAWEGVVSRQTVDGLILAPMRMGATVRLDEANRYLGCFFTRFLSGRLSVCGRCGVLSIRRNTSFSVGAGTCDVLGLALTR